MTQETDRIRLRFVRLAVVNCLVGCSLVQAQIQPQFKAQPDDLPESGGSLVVLPTPPRELRRSLQRAESGLEKKEFSEAIEILDRILQDSQQGDFFLPSTNPEAPLRSLRAEVQRLLSEMPPGGRKMYELHAGASARKILNEALQKGDIAGLGEVSRRFFHTLEGSRASYLLARYHLDRRQPTSAIMHLQRLRGGAAKARGWEPEVTILLAVAWQMAGRPETARSLLLQATTENPFSQITVAGKPYLLPTMEATIPELDAWLLHVAKSAETASSSAANWITCDGDATRDHRSAGGMPLPRLEWWNPLPFQSDAARVSEMEHGFANSDVSAIPLPRPLIVGDWVVMPTPRMLMGIRLQGGARRWYYPSNAFQQDASLAAPTNTRRETPGLQIEHWLRQRVWDDNASSHLSTDGHNVYCLRDLPPLREGQNSELFIAGGMGEEIATPRPQNRLVAVDVVGEGRTRWSVGKSDSGDERLVDAFFLGAPLPLSEALYVIAEMKDELRLVVLDSATGKMQWSQQLLQLELPVSVAYSQIRRVAGCSPSFRDGVLVCPTAAGTIIGVDPATRSLLWGFRYPTREMMPMQANPMMMMPESLPPVGNRWLDGNPLITESAVIVSPVESDKLYCLDLLTGDLRWPPADRGDGQYVAGVYRGVIAIVGQHAIRGIRLEDGEEAWPPILIPDNATPSGRGFINGPFAYFPTTASELLRIDIAKGTIAERMETESILGNLSCHGNYLISQSAGEVRAYLLRESLRQELTDQVAKSTDPTLLQDYANLLLGDGDAAQAMEVLRNAIRLSDAPAARQQSQRMLLQTILGLLDEDFNGHQALVEEARTLTMSPEDRRRLLHLIAEYRSKSGQVQESMDALMELADISKMRPAEAAEDSESMLRRLDGARRVSESVWLRTQFRETLRLAPEAELNKLLARVEQQWQSAKQADGTEALDTFLERFGDFPQEMEACLEGASRYVALGNYLRSELLLSDVRAAGNPEIASRATRLLATMLAKTEPATTLRLLQELREPVKGDAVSNPADDTTAAKNTTTAEDTSPAPSASPTGVGPPTKDPAENPAPLSSSDLALRTRVLQALAERTTWPTGQIHVDPLPLRAGENLRQPSLDQVDIVDDSASGHEGLVLNYDRESGTMIICDSLGAVQQQITVPLPQVWQQWMRLRHVEARICGSLLVFTAGPSVFAVDVSSSPSSGNATILWRYSVQEESTEESDLGSIFNGAESQEIRNPFLRNSDNNQRTIARSPIEIGPVATNGTCLLVKGNLLCLDSVTGTTRWQRQRLGEPKHIFGDSRYVMVAPRNGTVASVYSLVDGSELPSHKIPPTDQHWARRGTKILAWETTRFLGFGAMRLRLFLWDTMQEKRLWELDCEMNSKGCLVGQDEVAVLRPSGKLVIFNLLTGPKITSLSTELPLAAALPSTVQVIRNHNQYLVLAGTDSGDMRRQEVQVTGIHFGQGNVRIIGVAAAYDRASGAPLWKQPLPIQNYFVGAIHPPDSPVLILYRQIQAAHQQRLDVPKQQRQPGSDLIIEAVVIDRRDGSLILETTDIIPQAHGCAIRIIAKPKEKACDIIGTNGFQIRLNYTEDPAPPRTAAILPTVEKRLADYRALESQSTPTSAEGDGIEGIENSEGAADPTDGAPPLLLEPSPAEEPVEDIDPDE